MTSQIYFQLKKEYLLVRVTGNYNKTKFLAMIDEISARCQKENSTRVLIDALAVQNANISTTDRYFLGERIAQRFRNNFKITIAWPPEHIDRFAEIVASNRGVDIYVSGDLKLAEDWLIK